MTLQSVQEKRFRLRIIRRLFLAEMYLPKTEYFDEALSRVEEFLVKREYRECSVILTSLGY